MGWCQSSGWGAAPLSAQELRAWASGTGQRWAEWEFRALRAASAAYCSQLASKDAPEPAEIAERATTETHHKRPPSLIATLATSLNRSPKASP